MRLSLSLFINAFDFHIIKFYLALPSFADQEIIIERIVSFGKFYHISLQSAVASGSGDTVVGVSGRAVDAQNEGPGVVLTLDEVHIDGKTETCSAFAFPDIAGEFKTSVVGVVSKESVAVEGKGFSSGKAAHKLAVSCRIFALEQYGVALLLFDRKFDGNLLAAPAEEVEAAAEEKPEYPVAIELPLTEEPVSLSFWYSGFPNWDFETVFGQNPAVLKAEEMTGVHADINFVVMDAFAEKFNLMIASGEYPDFISSGAYVGG